MPTNFQHQRHSATITTMQYRFQLYTRKEGRERPSTWSNGICVCVYVSSLAPNPPSIRIWWAQSRETQLDCLSSLYSVSWPRYRWYTSRVREFCHLDYYGGYYESESHSPLTLLRSGFNNLFSYFISSFNTHSVHDIPSTRSVVRSHNCRIRPLRLVA